MRIIVTTSDGRKDVLRGFAERFNRYWGTAAVDVLGFESVDLPHNFWFHSLGKQADFGDDWTTPLIPWFAAMDDHAFVLLLDDYWLSEDVDVKRVAELHHLVEIGLADKIDLTLDRFEHAHHRTFTDSLVESDQRARYRTSIQAAVWDADYFRKNLKAGRSIWRFETRGYREAINDGAVILGVTKAVLKYENVTVKGEAQGQLKEERA